jgi:uncharacterized protein (TIGR02996 family)
VLNPFLFGGRLDYIEFGCRESWVLRESIMSSHPIADAFMCGFLRQPTDVTARLVFADWLEETGEAWNRAWAYYIRLKAEAGNLEFGSPEWRDTERQAAEQATRIAARLTIPAKLFVDYPRSLLQLLPGANITVVLKEFHLRPSILEIMPESVSRENLVFPLDTQGRVLLVATAASCQEDAIRRIEFMLNKDVVAVRGELEDVAAAINRHYGQTETESVDSVHYILPIEFDIRPGAPAGYGDEPKWVVQLVNSILRDARSRGADQIRVRPADGVGVQYRVGGEWSAPQSLPGHVVRPFVERVARMVDDRYTLEHEARANGWFICQLGPDRFLVRGTIELQDEGSTIQLELAADDRFDLP